MLPWMHDHKIYGAVTLNAKGQIVLPKEARKNLGIGPGDQLLVTSKGDQFIGLIKASNVEEFLSHIQKDLNEIKKHTRVSAKKSRKNA